MKRPTAQHGGARMKCNGDSLSLPLSLLFMHICAWQSADGRVTSDHCRVTVQWLFTKIFLIAWNVQKTLFDSRPTVAWPPTTVAWPFSEFFEKNFRIARNVQKRLFDSRPTVAWHPTTVAWPFSDFFQKFSKLLETSRKRRLTVGRRSRDLRLLSRDRSVTFSKILQIAWNVQKRRLTVGRRSRDLRPMSRDLWVTFFNNFPNCLKRPKNVVWQSADGRVTSDHCRVIVQWLFSKKFQIAWNVQKTLFDSRPTVAWPPTTVAWLFSDFFQKNFKLLETSKKRCLTVGRRSRDLRPLSRDRSVTFSKIFPNCLERSKTMFDSRPTVACLPTTVAWPFSDFFQNVTELLETFKKRCLTVGGRSRDLQPLSPDRSATFFKKFPNCLKRQKNVVWQSANGPVTPDHCRVTVQRLFSNFFPNCLKRRENVDSRPMVAWPPTAVAWPYNDLFQHFSQLLETSKKRCLTVGRR